MPDWAFVLMSIQNATRLPTETIERRAMECFARICSFVMSGSEASA